MLTVSKHSRRHCERQTTGSEALETQRARLLSESRTSAILMLVASTWNP